MNVNKRAAPFAAAALIGATVLGIPGAYFFGHYANAATAEQPLMVAAAPSNTSTSIALPDFSPLVDKYGAAVVNITVTGNTRTGLSQRRGNPRDFGFGDNDPFSQFFRGIPIPRDDQPTRGMGSGFIVRSDGIVLTNAHVVDDMKQVVVRLTDKREFNAKVLGVDKTSDVAVLKIDAKDLPTVRLGHETDLKVGQWVVAIGAPFGFDNTVTAGIVSAKRRVLPGDGYVPFIQTDVPINPGNSGGPLFDLNGNVVGINSQIYSRTGGYQGVSFAIPIDVALNVSQQIQTHGHVSHGKLGVAIQEVNAALADTFGLDKAQGALVSSVDEQGPAGRAGVKAGDVILSVNGKSIAQSTELPIIIAESEPGSTATLKVWRDKGEHTISVKLGDMSNEKVASNDDSGASHGKLGIAVRPLTSDEREQANTKGGLLVEQSSGAAAEAGIQQGDVVLSANGTPVKSVEELRRIVDKAGRHIALLVQRGDSRIFVPIALG